MDEKINFIRHYQNSIEKSKDNLERVLHCLKKLQNLRINVQDLQDTGIGKTVNSLREKDGEVGELATELIAKWKKLISIMNEDEHKFEAPQPPREKHESKKPEKSSSESSDSNNKKSKSSSSSSSNHHHSSSSSHNNHSSKHHTNHLSSTNNHQSSSSNHNHSSSSSNNHHHHHSEHKEKDHKKSNVSKSSENKHHKSHHTSSSSSHKTSNSHKRSREDAESKENESKSKKMKSDHEKSDKKSNNSNDVKETSSTSNGTSSKSKKKEHKSPTKRKHSNDDEQEFDGAMGMGFAEALAAFDMPTSSSSSKRQKQELADKMVSVKSSSSSSSSKSKSSSSTSSSHKKDKEREKSSSSSSSSSSRPSTSKTAQNLTQPPKLLTQKPKLDLLPDIVNELPSDVSIPDYRPLPLNSAMKDYINSSASAYGSSMQSRHNRVLSESDLLTESFSSQKSRTRVFSGNSRGRSDIPKLYEMCLRVLTENLDFVECTGGVPFDILRPALEKAKPDQLASIEYYNPYLLDDSDVLWKPHCQRKWKNRQPMEMESWREMYDRCTREDDEKLSRLTQNIRQMQEKTSNCVQKTKMAFVDTMVKAPRGVARKQEQFGTSRKPVVSPAARVEALKNLQPNLAVAGDVRLRVAAGLRDDAQQIVGRGTMQRASLVKKAPMMAKILSKFKR